MLCGAGVCGGVWEEERLLCQGVQQGLPGAWLRTLHPQNRFRGGPDDFRCLESCGSPTEVMMMMMMMMVMV